MTAGACRLNRSRQCAPGNARYEKGALILTSNRGFVDWGEVFGDPVVATALLDRLLHHAVVIQSRARATAFVSTLISSPSTCARSPDHATARAQAPGPSAATERP